MKSFVVWLRRITFAVVTIFPASQSFAGAIVSVQDVAGLGVPGVIAVSGGNAFGSWQFRTLNSDPVIAQAVLGGIWNWQFDWDLLISEGNAITPVSLSFYLTSPFSLLATAPVATVGVVNSGLIFGGDAMLGLDTISGDGVFIFNGSFPSASGDRVFLVVGNSGRVSASAVPEPLTASLVASGLIALAAFGRRSATRGASRY